MKEHKPDQCTVLDAIALANRAPSAHNTQPWRWLIGEESVHLMADRTRRPLDTDLVLGCGAALHHLRVAFAGLGWRAVVHRVPNPGAPDRLAAVEFEPATPSTEDIALVGAIAQRRTDRRRPTARPVAGEHLGLMVERVEQAGALLVPADRPVRELLTGVIDEASCGRVGECAASAWPVAQTRGHVAVHGRTAGTLPAARTCRDERDGVGRGEVWQSGGEWDGVERRGGGQGEGGGSGGELLILATRDDDIVSVLRAGEAASAALLTATGLGLATCALWQALEFAETRAEIRDHVLDGAACPHLVLRVGWAVAGAVPPRTPRRATSDTVGYLPGTRRPAYRIPLPRPES